MKIFHKEEKANGRKRIYFCGVRIFSYKGINQEAEHHLLSTSYDPSIKKFQALMRHKDEMHNLILGSSHAEEGFIPDSNDLNLSGASQDLYRMYHIYRYVCQLNPRKLKNIIVFFDVFHPGHQQEKTRLSYNCMSYKYLYHIPYAFPLKNTSIAPTRHIKKYILNKKFDVENYYGESLHVADFTVSLPAKDIVEKHMKANQRHNNEIQYFKDLLDLAKQHKHNVWVILPPLRQDYKQHLPPKDVVFRELFDVLKENKDIKLFDFMEDMDFNDGDFSDSDHLNSNGAAKLTQKIKKLMK